MRASRGIALGMAAATTLVLLLMLAQRTDASDLTENGVPKTFDFGAYVAEYKKYYNPLEASNRAKLFYSRTLSIFKTNFLYATGKIGYYLRQNQFTDLTPDEMKVEFASAITDLRPVDEAKMSPNTPADMFVLDEHGTPSNEVFEPMTEFALGKATDPTKESPIDFFSDSGEDISVPQLLTELHSDSTLAKDLSRVIDIESNRRLEKEDKARLEEARRANNIVYKPYVKPTNKNFDPDIIQTRGWMESTALFGDNYAKYIMDDVTFSLDPYPAPVVPKTSALTNGGTALGSAAATAAATSEGGILSSFVDSIKEFKDFFVVDVDDFVWVEEGDSPNAPVRPSAPLKQKKPVIKYDIDWRTSGCISSIKSQERCNSCATFASLDLLEFLYCRQMKTSTEFSVQYLVDCGGVTGLRGCRGGKLTNVGKFIMKNGLQLNSVYPYKGHEQQCPFEGDDLEKSYMLKPELTGWRMFSQISAWYKWIPKTPVVVGINMPSDFLGYSGGIHDGNNCVPDMVHAMLLVGSGKEDGKPFWLLKNSFAETWGEVGYFRLSKKAPIRCFNAAVVARANFKTGEQK